MRKLEGLSFDQVIRRQKKYGLNEVSFRSTFSELKIFLRQFKNILILILLFAAIITGYLGDFINTAVIVFSVLIMVFIGYSQERRVNRILKILKKSLKNTAIVIRDGVKKEIDAKEVTIGDLVILSRGNRVPADGVLIESNNLTVNESVLTGEWEPIDKKDQETIYAGSLIENGWGKIVVSAIGRNTKMGKIYVRLVNDKERATPYQEKIDALGKIIGGVVLLLCFYLFVTGIVLGRDPLEMFTLAIAVGVGAIPEGLPIAITVALVLGAQQVLKNKGLIKRLPAVEGLGSTSVICTDKTGTLTTGEMRVAGIYNQREKIKDISVLEAAILNIDAFVENFDQAMEKWIVRGRPTERALLLAGLEVGINKEKITQEKLVILEIPFSSSYKYSMIVRRLSSRKAEVVYLGDPSKLFSLILQSNKNKWKEQYQSLTSEGLRVLGVGRAKIDISSLGKMKNYTNVKIFSDRQRKLMEKLLKNGRIIGLIALHDPLRDSSAKSIKDCFSAGIKPVIITGDNVLTAQAVARKIGLDGQNKHSLTGAQWANLTQEEKRKIVSSINVFAQVDPIQKLEIVGAFQENGETVTMTGDGVNDAVAVREADVGVAVGSAADITKESADLILLNNSFKIIVQAIREGRIAIKNIKKIIAFLGTECFTELILVSLSIIGGLPSPILPAQILWENLFEGSLQGVALAYERGYEQTALRKNFDNHSLITPELKSLIFIFGIATDIILFGLYIFLYYFSDYSINHLRTIIFACIVFNSLLYLFSCKNLRKGVWKIDIFDNKYLTLTWIIGIVGIIVAIYWSGLQYFLKTVSLNLFDWIIILVYSLFSLFLFELIKWNYIKKEEYEM